jgi:flavin-dependent dehydrogenase
VAVVGAGPGGSAAAKRCAEHGLKTILLEKRKLPRHKVCTGMIMSEMAQTLIREEFGEPPSDVLTTPPYVLGLQFHAPEIEALVLRHRMPFAWRKDLDYWLNLVAQRAGVEMWERARVNGIVEEDGGYTLSLERDGESQLLKTRFLIGADGAISTVRKAVFPDIQMRFQLCMRLCYESRLELDPEYIHYFYFPDIMAFEINRKGDVFLLEITPRPNQGDGADIVHRAEVWLSHDYHFPLENKPLWRDGCYEPAMSRLPFSGPFPLAKDNVLLVGNAAGLSKPITGEGIGTAISSGLMAANAVIKASKRDAKAADFYLSKCQEMVATLGTIYPPPGKMYEEAKKGINRYLEALVKIYSRSMRIL